MKDKDFSLQVKQKLSEISWSPELLSSTTELRTAKLVLTIECIRWKAAEGYRKG
jgi:hypothetical protein